MAVRKYSLFIITLAVWLFEFSPGTVNADPVSTYFQARQAAGATLLPVEQVGAAIAHPGSYAGRLLDTAAMVSGLISSGGDRTALLTVNGQTVTVPLPTNCNGGEWIDAGACVRVLLLVVPDDPAFPSSVRLMAVAPEGDIVAAERVQTIQTQSQVSRSYSSLNSERRVGWQSAAADSGHPAGALSLRALAIYGPYRRLVRRWNHRLSEADVDKITTSILYFSDVSNIDPRLVVATIIAESDFDLNSTSHAGAMGLAQIMPDEALSHGVTNPYDPVQNISTAVKILRSHLDKYGGAPADAGIIPLDRIALTMAAYNAGPGAVRKYHGVPPYRETQRYVKKVASLYLQMCGGSASQEAAAR